MKINVDRGRCLGLGVCESLAPDVFEVNDAGELVLKASTLPEDRLSDMDAAVEGGPDEALRIER
ncbi:ferredoxin [Amycolatopsis lurida]|uniref:Ferredoxin n=1 Tax=Amycolatopsis lurida NRRL 2430 TaxID=1460371 RepID=A0A2P2FGK7_AMYLU|nr:ferredoxin [Amycolatopsis lurida]KFU75819.1 ferredoxin [Amycolatopsis lurida NRRL 2430]SEE32680.1 ferredoxin [Amycolatopsis lurida]